MPEFPGFGRSEVPRTTRHGSTTNLGTLTAKGAVAMTNVANILLLDEDDLMREATALLLVNRGAKVAKTTTIEGAISHLERQTFDVVVVDVSNNAGDQERWISRLISLAASCKRIVVCTEKPLGTLTPTISCRVLVKPYPFDRLVEAVFGCRFPAPRLSRSAAKPAGRRAAMHRRLSLAMRRGRA